MTACTQFLSRLGILTWPRSQEPQTEPYCVIFPRIKTLLPLGLSLKDCYLQNMGFNSVYRCLQELFPEVDARILKAVAIENPKDVDAAANDILTDVLPYLYGQSVVTEEADVGSSSVPRSTTGENCISPIGADDAVKDAENSKSLVANNDNCLEQKYDGCTSSLEISASDEVILFGKTESGSVFVLDQSNQITQVHEGTDNHEEAHSSVETNVLFSCEANDSRSESQQNTVDITTPSINEHGYVGNLNDQCHELRDSDAVDKGCDLANLGGNHEGDSYLDGSLSDAESYAQMLVCRSAQELIQDAYECHSTSNQDSAIIETGNFVDELNGNSEVSLNKDCSVEYLFPPMSVVDQMIDTPKCDLQSGLCSVPLPPSEQDNCVRETGEYDNDFTMNFTDTLSCQVCSIDVLEEVIQNAKNNKKTLFSAMESVISMMREVELQEKAAERAKEEASKGGLDMLVKVEELKQKLAHAKEANDMHAGEVYGERAILATEARELQSRLLNLSEERDKSLAMLDEMHQTLEARLAAAEKERKTADQEKLQKEEAVRKALVEQEIIMDKVVKEAKLLQEEAEENSKLREFLMDRGRIVDMLQGEISVVCQDISLLKEKFDERVPLSMSISSSQTSCILASSGSSLKSVASPSLLEQGDLSKNLENESPVSSVDDQLLEVITKEELLEQIESPKNFMNGSPYHSVNGDSPKMISEDERCLGDRREFLEDGWDIFNKDEELVS